MEGKKKLSLMATSIYLIIQDKWVKWQKISEAGKTASRKKGETNVNQCGGGGMDFRGALELWEAHQRTVKTLGQGEGSLRRVLAGQRLSLFTWAGRRGEAHTYLPCIPCSWKHPGALSKAWHLYHFSSKWRCPLLTSSRPNQKAKLILNNNFTSTIL